MGKDYFFVLIILFVLNGAAHLLGGYENHVTFPVIAAILLAAALIGFVL